MRNLCTSNIERGLVRGGASSLMRFVRFPRRVLSALSIDHKIIRSPYRKFGGCNPWSKLRARSCSLLGEQRGVSIDASWQVQKPSCRPPGPACKTRCHEPRCFHCTPVLRAAGRLHGEILRYFRCGVPAITSTQSQPKTLRYSRSVGFQQQLMLVAEPKA